MGIRRMIAILAASLAVTSCSLEPDDSAPQVTLNPTLSNGTLPLDETVTVTVTLRNVGFDVITLTGPSDCLMYIEIYDSDNSRVYSSAATCTGATVSEDVAAGAVKMQAFVWNGTTSAGARAAAGFYNVVPVALIGGQAVVGSVVTIAVEGG